MVNKQEEKNEYILILIERKIGILNIVTDFITWIQTKGSAIWLELLIFLAVLVIWNLIRGTIAYAIIKIFRWKNTAKEIKRNAFYKPLKIFLMLSAIYIGILCLQLPQSIINIAFKLFKVTTIILIANGFANVIKPGSSIFNKLKQTEKFKGNDNILNFVAKIIKIIVYVIAAFVVLAEFGYNLNGIIAGLGLGSVVIALASQDIAKSLFAGAMILMDKPFMIGDYIAVAGYEGTVEDIKFRSTRVRLLDGSVITIPNHLITESNIVNWNGIEQRRYSATISLSANSNIEKIKDFIKKLQEALNANENIKENSANVSLTEIKADAIIITIYFNTEITNYTEYLQLKQKVNLFIMELLHEENLHLSCNETKVVVQN